MLSSRENIIEAAITALSGLRATVLRDSDVPETIPPAGLVIVRSASPEIDDETLGFPRGYYMTMTMPIELYVSANDANTRATRLDDLAQTVYNTLMNDTPFLSLSVYVQLQPMELETLSFDGAQTILAANLPVRCEYDSSESI